MGADFFVKKCQTKNVTAEEFGICDRGHGTPAYVSYERPREWIARITNLTGRPVNFTAVDNCVDLRRPDGSRDFRCDAMLTSATHIVFIELKEQRHKWVRHAVEDQLQTTIDHFKASYDISRYRHKLAFACNRLHPNFQCSRIQYLQDFWNRNHVRLSLSNHVIIR